MVSVDYKGIRDQRALYQQTKEFIEGARVWRVFTIDYLRPPQRLSTHASINTALDEYMVYSDLSKSPSTYFTSSDYGRRVFEDRMRQYPLPYAEPRDFENMPDLRYGSGVKYPVNYIVDFSPPDEELMAKAIV